MLSTKIEYKRSSYRGFFDVVLRRLRFGARAALRPRLHRHWFGYLAAVHMQAVVSADPELIGRIQRSYLSNTLAPEQRLRALRFHFDLLVASPAYVRAAIYPEAGLEAGRFSDHGIEHRVLLKHLPGNGREGELSLLWTANGRLVAVATFVAAAMRNGERVLVIGGVQGSNDDAAADFFRELTRRMHGLRPMSALVAMLRAVAKTFGAQWILGVSDSAHAVYHPRARCAAKKRMSYDAIWSEHAGEPFRCGFHRLPVNAPQRALETVESRKRSMYRKRYAMLDAMEAGVVHALFWAVGLQPLPAPDGVRPASARQSPIFA